MKHCTIQFVECGQGHGRLTATNWVDHGCGTCERDALREEKGKQANELVRLRAETSLAAAHENRALLLDALDRATTSCAEMTAEAAKVQGELDAALSLVTALHRRIQLALDAGCTHTWESDGVEELAHAHDAAIAAKAVQEFITSGEVATMIQAERAKAREETLEECARLADPDCDPMCGHGECFGRRNVAKVIRARANREEGLLRK